MSFTNRGDRNIVVDRELVIGFAISITDETGASLLEYGDEVERPSQEQLQQRFVTLEPGKTLHRDLDLARGFKTFAAAISSGEGTQHTGVTSMELIQRLKPGRHRHASVEVSYEVLFATSAGIAQYVGRTTSDMGVFTGRATATFNFKPM
jgi:hypothetical protein